MSYNFKYPLLVNNEVFDGLSDGLYVYAVVQDASKNSVLVVHRVDEKNTGKFQAGYLIERYRQKTNRLEGIAVFGAGRLIVSQEARYLEWDTSKDFGAVPIIILKERISVLTFGSGIADGSVFNLEDPFKDSPRWYPAEYFIQKQFTT